MNSIKEEYNSDLKILLNIADLPRSTYYYHLNKNIKRDNIFVINCIKEIVSPHRRRYGYRKVTLELKQEYGITVNHKKVLKIMREEGLLSKIRRRKYKSYKGEVCKIAPNIIKRDFTATTLNKKWVTDITEFKVCDKKVYLSPIMDLFNREIIVYTIGLSPNMKLVLSMLDKAITRKEIKKGLIMHSDQGFQYQN